MAYQPAKASFTKEEVAAILRQNLVLYRDEPDFVEYFINLALYLIDQSYCASGARSTGIDQVLAAYEKLKNQTGASYGPTKLAEVLAVHRKEEGEAESFPPDPFNPDAPVAEAKPLRSRQPTPVPPPAPRPPTGESAVEEDHPGDNRPITQYPPVQAIEAPARSRGF